MGRKQEDKRDCDDDVPGAVYILQREIGGLVVIYKLAGDCDLSIYNDCSTGMSKGRKSK